MARNADPISLAEPRCSPGKGSAIESEGIAGDNLIGKPALDPLPSGMSHSGTAGGIAGECADGLSQTVDIVWRDKDSSHTGTDHFAATRYIGGN